MAIVEGNSNAKKYPKFDDLDQEFQNKINSAPEEEIRKAVQRAALDEVANKAAMAEDLDLAEKKEAVKAASAQYREKSKAHKLQIAYCHFVLDGRGKE